MTDLKHTLRGGIPRGALICIFRKKICTRSPDDVQRPTIVINVDGLVCCSLSQWSSVEDAWLRSSRASKDLLSRKHCLYCSDHAVYILVLLKTAHIYPSKQRLIFCSFSESLVLHNVLMDICISVLCVGHWEYMYLFAEQEPSSTDFSSDSVDDYSTDYPITHADAIEEALITLEHLWYTAVDNASSRFTLTVSWVVVTTRLVRCGMFCNDQSSTCPLIML